MTTYRIRVWYVPKVDVPDDWGLQLEQVKSIQKKKPEKIMYVQTDGGVTDAHRMAQERLFYDRKNLKAIIAVLPVSELDDE